MEIMHWFLRGLLIGALLGIGFPGLAKESRSTGAMSAKVMSFDSFEEYLSSSGELRWVKTLRQSPEYTQARSAQTKTRLAYDISIVGGVAGLSSALFAAVTDSYNDHEVAVVASMGALGVSSLAFLVASRFRRDEEHALRQLFIRHNQLNPHHSWLTRTEVVPLQEGFELQWAWVF